MMNAMVNLWVRVFALAMALTVSGGCGKSSPPSSKILRVGFVPAENAQQVIQNAQPIIKILRRQLGMEVRPFMATDYTGVVKALRVNKLDIAFLTPTSCVLAKNEANVEVVLKCEHKGSPFYSSAIITRADSGIQTLEWRIWAVRHLSLVVPCRRRPGSFCAKCCMSAASTLGVISSKFSTRVATTPRFWQYSTVRSTPAPPTPIPPTVTTLPGCAILRILKT